MQKLSPWLTEVARRAAEAVGKPAPLGPDIDLSLIDGPAGRKGSRRSEADRAVRRAALGVGVDLSAAERSGSYLQVDQSVLCSRVREGCEQLVEVRPVGEALDRRPELEECWWRLVPPDADKYTALTALRPPAGYFIRILAGAKVDQPVQSCLMMAGSGTTQSVHNVIIAEEGSEAHIVTGCTVRPGTAAGAHVGVSEFYVRRGASLTFTMIHHWSDGFHVRPRSAVRVDDGGTFQSNYILTGAVRSLQMYPTAVLRGRNSRTRFQAILIGKGNSILDVGSRTVHRGRGSRSETVSRVIGADRSDITARGHLEARTNTCRGHLECRGMITSKSARVRAVPELDARGAPGAELSHEAAISPIAEEEVVYLMSRGLSRDEAAATITRGFLNVDLPGLPPALQRSVEDLLSATAGEGL